MTAIPVRPFPGVLTRQAMAAAQISAATTLLGDPGVLILDEPLNGLDPDGIRWMRDLLRHLAEEGRTVLVSSHLLAEAAQTVDDVVVINQGRLAAEGPVADLAAATGTTRIRTPDTELLMSALARQEITARLVAAGTRRGSWRRPGPGRPHRPGSYCAAMWHDLAYPSAAAPQQGRRRFGLRRTAQGHPPCWP